MRAPVFVLLAATFMSCASAPAPEPVASGDRFQIESTVLAVYNVISGPAGRRDWDRFKALFVPGARMIVAKAANGTVTTNVMTPEEYIAKAEPLMAANGFFERPVANRVELFGDIAHVFSTYESRHAANDEKPFVRGINSVQLVRDGDTWKVVTIFWQAEDAAHPIPPQYLAPAR